MRPGSKQPGDPPLTRMPGLVDRDDAELAVLMQTAGRLPRESVRTRSCAAPNARYNEAILTGASQALLDRLHEDAERWRAAIQAEQDENHQ